MNHIKNYPEPSLFIECEADVGESPIIDAKRNVFSWVDLTRGHIYEKDLATGSSHYSEIGLMLGAIAPREILNGYALATEEGFGYWDGAELEIVDRCIPNPNLRMNDAKCDSMGRLWAGSTHKDYVPGMGKLHKWDGESPSTIEATNFILPNGIGWSPDDKTMYLADSFAKKIYSTSFNAETGSVGEFREFISVEEGLPDGIAVDCEGCIWLAVWGSWVVNRYNPNGELIGAISMPIAQPSSCAIGAEGNIYITSARTGISAEELRSQPHAGSVFLLEGDIPGLEIAPFRR